MRNRFHFKGIKQDREESAHDRKKRLPDLQGDEVQGEDGSYSA